MKFLSLEPFIPSGKNVEGSKQFFQESGFKINWDAGDYIGFQKNDCRFILQQFNNKEFAENFMLRVKVTNVDEFRQSVLAKQLPQKSGIRTGEVTDEPYGKECNMTDIAGVCLHFVQQ